MMLKADERILGDSEFVESVLNESNERLGRKHFLQTRGYDFSAVVERPQNRSCLGRCLDSADVAGVTAAVAVCTYLYG